MGVPCHDPFLSNFNNNENIGYYSHTVMFTATIIKCCKVASAFGSQTSHCRCGHFIALELSHTLVFDD